MKRFGYALGLGLVLVGAATGVADLLAMSTVGATEPLGLGNIWARVHPASLNALQDLLQGLGAVFWTPIAFVLALPAWVTLTLPGVVLVLACRGRRHPFDY